MRGPGGPAARGSAETLPPWACPWREERGSGVRGQGSGEVALWGSAVLGRKRHEEVYRVLCRKHHVRFYWVQFNV